MKWKTDRKRERMEKRNADIRKKFTKLHKKGFRLEVILTKLADEYCLVEETVRDIVGNKGNYKPDVPVETNQLDLFGHKPKPPSPTWKK
jgi:hypothetical protein